MQCYIGDVLCETDDSCSFDPRRVLPKGVRMILVAAGRDEGATHVTALQTADAEASPNTKKRKRDEQQEEEQQQEVSPRRMLSRKRHVTHATPRNNVLLPGSLRSVALTPEKTNAANGSSNDNHNHHEEFFVRGAMPHFIPVFPPSQCCEALELKQHEKPAMTLRIVACEQSLAGDVEKRPSDPEGQRLCFQAMRQSVSHCCLGVRTAPFEAAVDIRRDCTHATVHCCHPLFEG